MTILRNLYFANNVAFNLPMTRAHIIDLKDRLGDDEFPEYVLQSCLSDLRDLEYLVVSHDPDEWMIDIFTENLIARSTWFDRYGIRDPTFEFFNADGDDTIHTFEMDDTDISLSDIDSIDEMVLVEAGTAENPIDLTDSDVEY